MQACVLHKFLYSAKVVFERRQSLSFMPAAAFLARTLLRRACKGAGKASKQACTSSALASHVLHTSSPVHSATGASVVIATGKGDTSFLFFFWQALASCSPCQSSPCQVQLPLQGARCKRSTCCKSTQPPQTTDGTLRKFDARLITWDERNAPWTRW